MTTIRASTIAWTTLLAVPAAAAEAPPAGTVAAALSGNALTAASVTVLTLFLIAVLLESALALLFNWRPFVETFNARATRPLIAFLVAWVAVHRYKYDAVTALMDAVQNATTPSPPQPFGEILTAAILAGGSAGVNTMLVALGFREVKTPATVAPRVAPEFAWISVSIERNTDRQPVSLYIGKPDPGFPADLLKVPRVGEIAASTKLRQSALARFFLRQIGRFPPFGGGYLVKASEPCTVALVSSTGTLLKQVSFTPAPGAIIDLNFPV